MAAFRTGLVPGTAGTAGFAGAPSNPLLGGFRSGGMQGVLGNPLFHAGLGLLSQGPSLVPQSPFQGLAQGMASWGQTMALQREQERQNAALELKRQEMENKRRAREAAAETEKARAAAVAKHSGGDPLAAAFPDVYARTAMAPPPTAPAGVRMAEWLADPNVPESAKQAAREWRRAGATQINLPGQGIRAETDLGKTVNDLQRIQERRAVADSPELMAAENALRAKLAKQSAPPAEQAERETKYATTLDAARRMMELRKENPSSVGPGRGQLTQFKGQYGVGTQAEGEMRALDATMRSRLGTALSGAAIPASEWPTYQAQLPLVTDSDEVAAGKMKALEETIEFLEERARQLRGQTDSGMSIDWDATNAPPATTTPLPQPGVVQWSELP